MPDIAPPESPHMAFAPLAQQISGDWPQVMVVWEEFRRKHGYYLRPELSDDREQFLQQALWQAHGRGHLRALLTRCQEAGLAAPGLPGAAAPFLGAGSKLQSYVNGAWKPQNALINGRRFIQACDHICRISIDGKHKGTGVLIRPTLVVTAAHVIESLVGGERKPLEGSVGRLKVSFFDADDLMPDGEVAAAQPIDTALHQDWLAYYSPRADGEMEDLYPIDGVAGIKADEGPWDCALIRLAAPPRAGVRGYPLLPGNPPAVTFGLHVLHHPANPLGAPMGLLWSIGSAKKALGSGAKPLRWLHDANTDRGSSGAPCFNDDWRIVAFHQAGQDDVQALNQSNRAVPIYRWVDEVNGVADQGEVTPYLSHAIDENRASTPVLGRRLLQDKAWRAMTSWVALKPQQRVFVVLGEPRTGKSFTTAILTGLSERAGCVLAAMDVRNSADATPLAFAQAVLDAVGATRPQGAGDGPSGLTTELRDVSNDIIPRLGQTLQALAQQRPLWLVLDGLEICDTAAPGVAQVVDGLLAALAQFPALHLALIGWKGVVQADHVEGLSGEPSVADILDHLLLTVAPPGYQPAPEVRAALLNFVQLVLNQQPPVAPYARAAAAALAARDMIKALIGPTLAGGHPA